MRKETAKICNWKRKNSCQVKDTAFAVSFLIKHFSFLTRCGKMFIRIKEQFIIIRCTSIGGNKDMILKYKNEYNDYYEFWHFN